MATRTPAPSRVPRALLLVAGTVLVARAAVAVAGPPLHPWAHAAERAWHRGEASPLTALPPDEALAGLCATALLAALVVWSFGVVATLVEVLAEPARARVTLPCPRIVRSLALAALGAGVTAAPPALADPGPDAARPPTAVAPAAERAGDVTGLPLPDRVPTHRTAVGPGAQAAGADRHVVRRGDTLWSVAASTLPPGATTADLDRGWRRIAAANRDVVADPHLIFPGTELRLPPLTDTLGKDQP